MQGSHRDRDREPEVDLIVNLNDLFIDSESIAAEALRRFLHGHGHEMRPDTLQGALGRRLPEAIAAVAGV